MPATSPTVFGYLTAIRDHQVRAVVAADSIRDAMSVFDVTPGVVRPASCHGCETTDAAERRAALAHVRTVLVRDVYDEEATLVSVAEFTARMLDTSPRQVLA